MLQMEADPTVMARLSITLWIYFVLPLQNVVVLLLLLLWGFVMCVTFLCVFAVS